MKRKKSIVLILVVLCMSMCLAGCKKEECFFCGEEKFCKTYENMMFGKIKACDTCIDDLR